MTEIGIRLCVCPNCGSKFLPWAPIDIEPPGQKGKEESEWTCKDSELGVCERYGAGGEYCSGGKCKNHGGNAGRRQLLGDDDDD